MQCKARSKRSGAQCKRTAVPGAEVCTMHGGKAPQVVRAANRRLALAEAEKVLGDFLAEEEEAVRGMDPAQHLLDGITRTAAMVRVLSRFVNRLTPVYDPMAMAQARAKVEEQLAGEEAEAIANGRNYDRPTVLSGALYGPNHQGDGKPHVLVAMLGEWEDRLARLSKLAIDAGVEERRVKIAEDLGRTIVGVLQGVLSDLGVADHPDLPAVLGARLRAIETTGASV